MASAPQLLRPRRRSCALQRGRRRPGGAPAASAVRRSRSACFSGARRRRKSRPARRSRIAGTTTDDDSHMSHRVCSPLGMTHVAQISRRPTENSQLEGPPPPPPRQAPPTRIGRKSAKEGDDRRGSSRSPSSSEPSRDSAGPSGRRTRSRSRPAATTWPRRGTAALSADRVHNEFEGHGFGKGGSSRSRCARRARTPTRSRGADQGRRSRPSLSRSGGSCGR